MNKFIQKLLPVLALLVLLVNCRKKEWDAYYGRPENLAPPIYQQLGSMGKFKNLLVAIDRAGYKSTLSAAGYWTMFAPNDSAFAVFLKERGLNDVAQLDSATCKKLVTYCLVYNAFEQDRLTDYQANTGWVAGAAYKRRTANYKGFYDDTNQSGESMKAIDANRNGSYVMGDNNNKYIPYFLDKFLTQERITATDYNYFYPNVTYTGFNVVDANVVKSNIAAENGVIHEINKVVLPLANLEEYLASKPEYSEFKRLVDQYMVSYLQHSTITERYRLLTGKTDNVFVKFYTPTLGFSLNNENYLKQTDNDGQTDGWTLFVPTNDVLKKYMDEVILEEYKKEENLPLQVITDLLNAHMFTTTVWPSKFVNTNNVQAEPARFDPVANIIDRQILSNGIFYGTNKVQLANVFTTVYGKPYLDPKYLLMTKALDANLRYTITVPNIKYTMVMMSDDVLRARGFDFNYSTNAWVYTAPGATTSSDGGGTIQRILGLHILKGQHDLSGSGIAETANGEYVRYDNMKVYSPGTPLGVDLSGFKEANNGKVYYGNSLFWYTSNTIGKTIVDLVPAGSTVSNNLYYNFVQYLKSATIFNASTGEITGVTTGVFYTVFIPDNASILRAVAKGLLPKKSDGTPNFAPTDLNEQSLVNNFIRYHILNKNTVVPDGERTGRFETLYKTDNGDARSLGINSVRGASLITGSMTVTDDFGKAVQVNIPKSNILADRCVIHLVSDYLEYNPN